MNEDKHEVFRGHLEECLKHLGNTLDSRAPRGSRGAARAKKPIADFCGVEIKSVNRWLQGTSFPVGEQRIKLMCYLDMVGYRIIELERMSKGRRNFAELVGYGLLTSEKAAEFLGYAKTSTVYQVLQSHHGISDDREQKMWDGWKARKEELLLKKEDSQELYRLYRLVIPLKINSKVEKPKPSILPSRQMALVNIMGGLLSLLEEGSLSDSDFANLQRSADTILRLSAHLSSLSSRLIMSEQQKGGS